MKKKEYDLNYIKTKCKGIKLLLNKKNDSDILLFLETKDNVNGYLKNLIREDIMKERQNHEKS